MKRTPLARRTPLVARTPLRAVGGLLRRTPLAKVSQRRHASNQVRRAAVAALYAAAPFCARCGRGDVPLAGHERLGRAQGGNPADPDCLLCHPCNEWCESNPREAAETGWKLSRKWPSMLGLANGEGQ